MPLYRNSRFYLLLVLLIATPSLLQAEDLLTKEQSMLYYANVKRILTPTELTLIVIWSFIQSFLITLFAGRVIFGPTSLLWRTIKLWFYSLLLFIGFLAFVFVMVSTSTEPGAALTAVGWGLIIFSIVGLFVCPMRVFGANFLQTLCYVGVILLAQAACGFITSFAAPYLLGPTRGARLHELNAAYKELKILPDKDYSATEEDNAAQARDAVLHLQEEAAELKARYAELNKRRTAATSYNVSERTQYEQDQKKYAQDLAAYNERLKKVQAAVPQPSIRQPAAPQPSP